MKKLIYVFISILFLVSCEKEDADTIDQKLLIGNWEKIEINLTVSCTDYLEFNTKSFRTKEICQSSSSTGFFHDYKLEGKKVIVDGAMWYDIVYVSSTLLKLHDSQGNFREYKKP